MLIIIPDVFFVSQQLTLLLIMLPEINMDCYVLHVSTNWDSIRLCLWWAGKSYQKTVFFGLKKKKKRKGKLSFSSLFITFYSLIVLHFQHSTLFFFDSVPQIFVTSHQVGNKLHWR